MRWSRGRSARSVSLASPTSVDVHRVADRRACSGRCRSARRAPGPPWAATPSRGSSSRPSAACRSRSSARSSAACRAGRSSRSRTAGRPAGPPGRAAPSRRPAPSSSATSTTSSSAPSAPWPARIATFSPAFRISAARSSSSVGGTILGGDVADARSGSCRARAAAPRPPSPPATSFGTISVQTARSAMAMRTARSTRCRACAGSMHIWTYSDDVLEERDQVDLLLVLAAERHPLLLADDRDHGRVVELRVVEAVQEMDRARARGRQADADLAGVLRVPAGHERGHLLVARLDELRVAVGAVERAQERVDPVARVAVDAVDAPLAEAFEDVVGDELGHVNPFRFSRAGRPRRRRAPATAAIGPRRRSSSKSRLRGFASSSNGTVCGLVARDGLEEVARAARRRAARRSAARRSRCARGSGRATPGATVLPKIALTVGQPTMSSRRRCSAAQAIASAATSGWKIGGTGCGWRGIFARLQVNCGVFSAGSCTIVSAHVRALVQELGAQRLEEALERVLRAAVGGLERDRRGRRAPSRPGRSRRGRAGACAGARPSSPRPSRGR